MTAHADAKFVSKRKSTALLLMFSAAIGLVLLNREMDGEIISFNHVPYSIKNYIADDNQEKNQTARDIGSDEGTVSFKTKESAQKDNPKTVLKTDQESNSSHKSETVIDNANKDTVELQESAVKEKKSEKESVKLDSNDPSQRKYILLYTNFFDIKNWFLPSLGHDIFVKSKCPVSNCYIDDKNTRRRNVEDYDALLFHMRNFEHLPDQRKRRRAQRYIMFLAESPIYDSYPYYTTRGLFNWTATYRDDSNMSKPYGWMEPINEEFTYAPKWSEYPELYKKTPFSKEAFAKTLPKRPLQFQQLANKTKMVAWAVSNCDSNSKRGAYVDELQKYIQVDIFGICGQNVKQHDDAFEKEMESQYKFYLSFENSLCDQYVTEKLFYRLRFNILPIVYGKANYSQILPPHSYVDILDFPSAKSLAEYLLKLSNDPVEYLSYFWWKDHYKVRYKQSEIMTKMMCRLCEMLHSNLPEYHYEDLHQWWIEGSHCETSPTYKLR